MEKPKEHIQHVMLWQFKNNKDTTEIAMKICSVYGQSVITNRQVWYWFLKFHSDIMLLRDEPRSGCLWDLDEDALRELVKYNLPKNTQELASKHPNLPSWKRLEKWASWVFSQVFFQVREITHFSKISLEVMKNRSLW